MRVICFLTTLLIIFLSCKNSNTGDTDSRMKEGLKKTYDEKGNLKTEINYRGGLKHGKSVLYYEGSDQVMLEMFYEEGKRSGMATKYYESGKVYAETPYENDEVNGVVKLYFRNGNLKAEIPYNFSKPGLGLREYLMSGELKTKMPEIEIRKQKLNGQYIYYFSIDDCTSANFFIGALLNNQYLIPEPPFVDILPLRNGEAIFGFTEDQMGNTVNIICKCNTSSNNPYVTRKVIELGKI